jgi:hypothetical protein
MEKTQKYINGFNNITSVDSNSSLNDTAIDENSSYIKVMQKNGEIEMIINEPYIDYNDANDDCINYDNKNVDDSDDNLSEFSEYCDYGNYDDLEHSLDFKFDFDIIFTPEKNSELLQITEIKSKIVNRLKLNALDLSHIKTLGDNEKFDLIKLFNHMV